MIDPVLSPGLRLSVCSDSHQDLLPVPFDAPKSSGSLQRMGLGNMKNRGMWGISFICIKPGLYTAPLAWQYERAAKREGRSRGLETLVPPGLLNDAL